MIVAITSSFNHWRVLFSIFHFFLNSPSLQTMQRKRQSLGIQVSLLLLAGFAALQLLPTDFPFQHTHDKPIYDADG